MACQRYIINPDEIRELGRLLSDLPEETSNEILLSAEDCDTAQERFNKIFDLTVEAIVRLDVARDEFDSLMPSDSDDMHIPRRNVESQKLSTELICLATSQSDQLDALILTMETKLSAKEACH